MVSSVVSCILDTTKDNSNNPNVQPSSCTPMESNLSSCVMLSQSHGNSSNSNYTDSILRIVSSNTSPPPQCLMPNGVDDTGEILSNHQSSASCNLPIDRNCIDEHITSSNSSNNSNSLLSISQPLQSNGVHRSVLGSYSPTSSVGSSHSHYHSIMPPSQHNTVEGNEHYVSSDYQLSMQMPLSHGHCKGQPKHLMHRPHNTVSSSMIQHHSHNHAHSLLQMHHDRNSSSDISNTSNNSSELIHHLNHHHMNSLSSNLNSNTIRDSSTNNQVIDGNSIPQSATSSNVNSTSISTSNACGGLNNDSLPTNNTISNVCQLSNAIDHPSQASTQRFLVKNELVTESDLVNCMSSVITGASSQNVMQHKTQSSISSNSTSPNTTNSVSNNPLPSHHDNVMPHLSHHQPNPVSNLHHSGIAHVRHQHHFMGQQHLHHMQQQHIFSGADLAAAVAVAAAAGSDPRHHAQLHYGSSLVSGVTNTADCLTTQKAVAFLAGPRERIHVLGNPVEHCPRCQQQGLGATNWRPHRHIGELKIRYICERHFDDLESHHHFDIPLCPICNQVLYLYDFNNMLGVSNARRLHKYVLKCANRHVLPLLDLFCQTKKSGEKCNANFKLQWCYGTMVKRCEAQKNRDHDLWWVRYKNEWKQRRTIIRYKKDFLSHLTDAQRSLLLGLGLEGEPPPDPKSALGPTFDALISFPVGSPNGPKIKKRAMERSALGQLAASNNGAMNVIEGYDINGIKRRFRTPDFPTSVSIPNYSGSNSQISHQRPINITSGNIGRNDPSIGSQNDGSSNSDPSDNKDNGLRHVMGTVVLPPNSRSQDDQNQMIIYLSQQQQVTAAEAVGLGPVGPYTTSQGSDPQNLINISTSMIITGTPTPPLPSVANGCSSVAVSVVGEVICSPIPGG